MQTFQISPELAARVARRQGRAHTFESIDPARTALIVVDMQNYFMAPGQQMETPAAREIVPNVNRLASALRKAGGHVVWIRNRGAASASWPSYEARYTPEQWETREREMTPGAHGYELWPELEPDPADLTVEKTRFSAFIQGASLLDGELRRRGVTSIAITGVATNICCESTARDGMMLGYDVLMVSDGCATLTAEEHSASLTGLYLYFADVQSTDEVLSLIEGAANGSAAGAGRSSVASSA